MWPGIAAIHDPLRDVDAGAGDVRLPVQIGHFVDRSAVNSHADRKFGMLFECLADFERAAGRRFGASAKDKSAMPSPVGKRSSLPSARPSGPAPSRARYLVSFCICSFCSFMSTWSNRRYR